MPKDAGRITRRLFPSQWVALTEAYHQRLNGNGDGVPSVQSIMAHPVDGIELPLTDGTEAEDLELLHNLRALEQHQERERQERERERQARRVQELERKMREHKRQAKELKKGLETVRALAEAAGDEKTRLAIVRTALAEIARSGREKRAEKLETDPWRICARRAILAAIEADPALNNTDLTDKVVEGLKTDKIRGRSRRQIERVIADMRDGGIIPTLPPR
jgi:hypothetical protein